MSSDLIFWICAALLLLLEVCLYIGLRSSSKTEVETQGSIAWFIRINSKP